MAGFDAERTGGPEPISRLLYESAIGVDASQAPGVIAVGIGARRFDAIARAVFAIG